MKEEFSESRLFESISGVCAEKIDPLVELNRIIADVLFNFERAGEQVHLDLDDQALLAVEERYGINQDEFADHIVESVCGISLSGSPEDVFRIFSEATRRWNNLRTRFQDATLTSPPALALLGMLSLAAESMRREIKDGEQTVKISAKAYYIRLAELVGREAWTVDEIQSGYRNKKEKFEVTGQKISRSVGLWQSLETWLSRWEGERGICTVPIPGPGDTGMWAVNMPISQALMREADRENLRKMFGFRNLNPTVPISEEMMFVLLDEWCTSYGTGHLKSLWKNADYRESIVGGALSTLASWAGVSSTPDAQSETIAIGVGLTLDLNAFTRRVDFGIEIRTGNTAMPESVDILDEDGNKVRTRLQPSGPQTARVADYSAFDAESLISGVLQVSSEENNLYGRRFPRPIVPFVASSAGNSYSEVSATTLSARHGVLVRATTDDGYDLFAEVRAMLEQIARPGWSVVEPSKYSGLPNGWVFVQNVEFVSIPVRSGSELHIDSLAPLALSTMSFSGGFRVPGRRERWLSSSAPSVLAVFPYETSIELTVTDSVGNVKGSLKTEERVAVFDLAPLGLSAGTYVVEASPRDGMQLSKTLYLVGSDTPNLSTSITQRPLGHTIRGLSTFGMISATEQKEDSVGHVVVRGLDLRSCEEFIDTTVGSSSIQIPTVQKWGEVRSESSSDVTDLVKIERAPLASCLVGRGHHWMLPLAHGNGYPKFVSGHCMHCGRVGQHPGRPVIKAEYRLKRVVKVEKIKSPNVSVDTPLSREEVNAVPRIQERQGALWDQAFESVCYLRAGSISDLAYIVGQVSGGSVGVDRIVRSLSALGHIDVELDDRCRPGKWSVSPAVVVVTSESRGHLAGFRSKKLVAEVTDRVQGQGGRVEHVENYNSPTIIEIHIPEGCDFEDLLSDIVDPTTGSMILVQRNCAARLLGSLSSINAIAEACPEIPRPASRKINKWDGFGARWVSAESDLEAGAYQNIGNGYVYTFHHDRIDLGDYLQSGTASLVKHWESLRAGVPLFFYSSDSRVLCLRLGAELPGLFGRAVISLSGRAPEEDEKERLVKYHNVDKSISQTICQLLRS